MKQNELTVRLIATMVTLRFVSAVFAIRELGRVATFSHLVQALWLLFFVALASVSLGVLTSIWRTAFIEDQFDNHVLRKLAPCYVLQSFSLGVIASALVTAGDLSYVLLAVEIVQFPFALATSVEIATLAGVTLCQTAITERQ